MGQTETSKTQKRGIRDFPVPALFKRKSLILFFQLNVKAGAFPGGKYNRAVLGQLHLITPADNREVHTKPVRVKYPGKSSVRPIRKVGLIS